MEAHGDIRASSEDSKFEFNLNWIHSTPKYRNKLWLGNPLTVPNPDDSVNGSGWHMTTFDLFVTNVTLKSIGGI